MMTITRQVSDKTVVTFDGIADETFAPDAYFAKTVGEVFVVGAKVKRINSTAAKRWIACFETLKTRSVPIRFVAVSPAIVEQMNLISNFNCGFPILSAVLPFTCTACKHSNFVVQTKEEALSVNLDKVDWPCVHCQKPALEFDDIPDEYLGFWKR